MSAQYRRGIKLYNTQNYGPAAHYFLKAAEQDYPEAQRRLALCYKEGKGVDKNITRYTHWMERAAKKGDSLVQNDFGWFRLQEGKEEEEAKYWSNKSGEQHDSDSLYSLAQKHLQDNVPFHSQGEPSHHIFFAFELFQLLAKQGHAPSQRILSCMYTSGRGILTYRELNLILNNPHSQHFSQEMKNYEKKILFWTQKAATSGFPFAQIHMSFFYLFAKCGLKQDLIQAVQWGLKAKKQGVLSPSLTKAELWLANEKKHLKKSEPLLTRILYPRTILITSFFHINIFPVQHLILEYLYTLPTMINLNGSIIAGDPKHCPRCTSGWLKVTNTQQPKCNECS